MCGGVCGQGKQTNGTNGVSGMGETHNTGMVYDGGPQESGVLPLRWTGWWFLEGDREIGGEDGNRVVGGGCVSGGERQARERGGRAVAARVPAQRTECECECE